MSTTTLAPEMYVTARRGIACVRLLPTVDVTLCGRIADGPAVFNNPHAPRSVTSHCVECAERVRADGGNVCERVECSRTPSWVAFTYGRPERLCTWHTYAVPGRIALPA